jgi:hypothetical protein
VDNLSIGSGSKLDLTDNAAAVNYTGSSPITTIRNQVLTAFNGGAWTGNGISSATAAANAGSAHATGIGIAEASALSITSFHGDTVDASTVLLKHTYYGDANLDGIVNTADFSRLATSFNGSNKFWDSGDFNYDGVVNALDFNALAGNFGQSLASPALGALVPEPASALLCAVGIGVIIGRKARKPLHKPRRFYR